MWKTVETESFNFFIKISLLLLFNSISGVYSLNVRPGEKWSGGVIKYKFHNSLTLADIAEAKKAFDEYQSKTCIRFQPWKSGEPDFVSIELDSSVSCSSGQWCKKGGYQYVRIWGVCRKMTNIVHSIGFALCLDNEHKRIDRDKYLTYQDNCIKTPQKEDVSKPMGMFDYESQWHWSCNSCKAGWPSWPNVTQCGWDVTPGLSVLDADNINTLYNCQGCSRHRWRPIENLSHKDLGNMYNFGYETRDGAPLYPCRARIVVGHIFAGRFDVHTNSCHISYDKTHYEILTKFEVLTIPGGLSEECADYRLVNKENAEVDKAIQVGSWAGVNKWKSFIAYASVNRSDGITENTVGNVWVQAGKGIERFAEVSIGVEYKSSTTFKVLTCSEDTACMVKQLFAERKQNDCK